MSVPRVLFLTRTLTVHDERFLRKITGWGYEVLLVCLEGPGNAPLPDAVHGKRWPEELSWERQVEWLRETARDYRPDLIHAGPLPTAAAMAAQADLHPLISMSWGSDILTYSTASPQIQQRIKGALRGADACVADCRTVRAAISRIGALDERRIGLFPWGIDLNRFQPGSPIRNWRREWGAEGRRVLLHTRSISRAYGVDTLIRALARSAMSDILLVLAGTGPDPDAILDLAGSLGVRSQIRHVAILPNQDLPDLFRSADAYVSCSPTDGTSISMLEAMATGVPILVPANESNKEWIESGINGWLFPVGTEEGLAEILRSFRRTPAIESANTAKASRRADWDRNSEVLREMYERLRSEDWPPDRPLESGFELIHSDPGRH